MNPKANQRYRLLVEQGRKAANMQWQLGDLAMEIDKELWSLEEYAEDIGVEYDSLRRYRDIAKAYPVARRLAERSWSLHQVFAAQKDRFELITRQWTVREARAFLVERNKPKPNSRQDSKPNRGNMNPNREKPPNEEPEINDPQQLAIAKANISGAVNRIDAANVAWGKIKIHKKSDADWILARISEVEDSIAMLKMVITTTENVIDDELEELFGK